MSDREEAAKAFETWLRGRCNAEFITREYQDFARGHIHSAGVWTYRADGLEAMFNAFIGGLAASALRERGWVPVSERLPAHGESVMTTGEIHGRVMDYGSVANGFPAGVTHWMPLPAPPAMGGEVDCGQRYMDERERAALAAPASEPVGGGYKTTGSSDCGNPECLCGPAVYHDPLDLLRFLSGRFKHSGATEQVLRSYARDIDATLAALSVPTAEASTPSPQGAVALNDIIAKYQRWADASPGEPLWPAVIRDLRSVNASPPAPSGVSEEMVERVAKAVYQHQRDEAKRMLGATFATPIWNDASEELRAVNRQYARVAIAALASRPAEGVREECAWTTPDDDGVYATACGREWVFTEGSPQDNDVKFCMGCGKPVAFTAALAGGK